MIRNRVVAFPAALMAALTAAAWLLASVADPKPAPQSPLPRTAVIVLENREYDNVIGSPKAPFLNGLAQRGTLATRYFGVRHPSLPNYLAILGGSTFGIDRTCTDCWAWGDNLAEQMSRTRISWRAYMEDMPERCFAGAAHLGYAKKHNPFMYFSSIASVPGRCNSVVPATRLYADLREDRLPTFTWITPNLCNGAHDCSMAIADAWLSGLVPRITRKLGPGGVLVITFDEGTTDAGCCRGSNGGQIVTLFVGPGVRRGGTLNGELDHYSLLATIQDRYSLPRLRMARGARAMTGALLPGAATRR